MIRGSLKQILLALVVLLGAAWTQEAWANYAAGSRLIFYYRQTSFDTGGAISVISVTNRGEDDINVQFVIRNGANCTAFGPVTQALDAGATSVINIGDFVSAGTFPEGIVDLYAVRKSDNMPIQWDQLIGNTTIGDLGLNSATIVSAIPIFSDDDNRAEAQGGLFTPGDAASFGAINLSTPFFPTGSELEERIVIFSLPMQPGGTPVPNDEFVFSFEAPQGGVGGGGTHTVSCVYSQTLGAIYGQGFSSDFPGGGALTILPDSLNNPGFVGWRFLTFQSGPFSLVTGHVLEQYIGLSERSHN